MATAVRKLVVEVVEARNLLPKDGHGTSSPYVVIDFYGQRKKTRTIVRDLNPIWNETLDFNVGKPSDVFTDVVEVDVLHDRNVGPITRHNFLGRVRLSSSQFVNKGEEALIYYPLEKKHLFNWIQGEIGLKAYFLSEALLPPTPPPAPLPTALPAEEAQPAALGDGKTETETPQGQESASGEVQSASPPAEEGPPLENLTVEHADPDPVQEPDKEQIQTNAPDQVMASVGTVPPSDVRVAEPAGPTRSSSIPQAKLQNFQGPRPIRRSASVNGFPTDASEITPTERSSFDLVEKMHYLFVRVVKARSIPTFGKPVVKITVSGAHVVSKPARKTSFFEWDQTFALNREAPDSSSILEVSLWDPLPSKADVAGHNFLGGICFDVYEIPMRDPPDSSLAPQWYRLEGGAAHEGDLMLATWVGTQADESFPDAWKTDTSGYLNQPSKVYQSPKLWYLRSTVIEAQDISFSKGASYQVKAQLGFQTQKTKLSVAGDGSPSWNEDLLFVASEPFAVEDHVSFLLIESRQPKEQVSAGITTVALTSIERRVDDRKVMSRWFTFEDPNEEKRKYKGRVHLRLCFDGGYHVMDEEAQACSDYRPTAKQLWKPPMGTVEIGIIGCKNLLPTKTINGKGSTDAYAVAKYGSKWVRTRTISNSLDPRWNEQFTWKVYEPSTALTVGVFDSSESGETITSDIRVGKVRVRLSTLSTGKIYRNTYPLLVLSQSGLKKMGEIELVARFVRSCPTIDVLHLYTQPLPPIMHHVKPLGVAQQEMLRAATVKIVSKHLSRSEPPLRREVVKYMLEADSRAFSMRKVRANWFRIINLMAGVIEMIKWMEDTRSWKNPMTTMLVHALLVMLVWFPDLIIPTILFYVFAVGAWNYRFRSRYKPSQLDPKISLAESAEQDELEEEFDGVPCGSTNEKVRARYDKMRMLGERLQILLGDIATQGERVKAIVTWQDPTATGMFVGACFVVSLILYLVPTKVVAMASGTYYLRHPIFKDGKPSPVLSFIRRLPSLSDRMF